MSDPIQDAVRKMLGRTPEEPAPHAEWVQWADYLTAYGTFAVFVMFGLGILVGGMLAPAIGDPRLRWFVLLGFCAAVSVIGLYVSGLRRTQVWRQTFGQS